MRVVQAIGVPGQALETEADAVVALKSRFNPGGDRFDFCGKPL